MSLVLLYFSFPTQYGGSYLFAWIAFIPILLMLDRIRKYSTKMIVCWALLQLFFMLLFWINPFNLDKSFYQPGNYFGTIYIVILIPLVYSVALFLISLLKGHPFVQASLWTLIESMLLQNIFSVPMSFAITQFNNFYLIQVCSIAGMYGITFLLILSNITIADLIINRGKKEVVCIGICLFSLIVSFSYGYFRTSTLKYSDKNSYKLSLIQPNHNWQLGVMSQQNKIIRNEYEKDYIYITNKAVKKNSPDLIVWPEGALNIDASSAMNKYVRSMGRDIIYGGTTIDPVERKPKNSIFMISSKNHISSVYSKEKLAPFFETNMYKSEINNTPFYLPDRDISIGPLVCFETLFQGIVRKHVSMGANIIICLSNDSFFGGSNLIVLHAISSIFRAVEFARPVTFINNTGFSVVSDHLGKILLISAINKASISSISVNPYQCATFFYLYPNILVLACLLFVSTFAAKEVRILFVSNVNKRRKNYEKNSYGNDINVCGFASY